MTDDKIIPLQVKNKKAAKTDEKALEHKWGKKVIAYGYTVVPSVLIQGQKRLGLTPIQLNVILQLLDHWWERDSLPFPSKKTIADRLDMSPRYIQTVIGQLEQAGFIRRIARMTRFGDRDSNAFDLTGLVERLKELELEFTKAKEDKQRIQKTVETPKGRRRK